MTSARAALDARDANRVLHWVRQEDEAALKDAFQHTLRVRALGAEARNLADRYFFETVVRVHRAGEGAPYTGLTDGEPEPIIAATDRALESGSTRELEAELLQAVHAGLVERFAAARAAKRFRPGDVSGGRAFVVAYVPLTHWVEGVFTAAKGTGEHHAEATDHDAPPTTITPRPSDHAKPEATTETHDGPGSQRLPWLLSGLLALAAVVEGVLLVRRRRPGEAVDIT